MWKYFKDLERTMSVRGLNDLAIEMAELYANSAAITKADLAQENDMTVKLVSELLDYAVVHSLVSEATVGLMERRSLSNQKRHSPEGESFSAKHHYAELRRKRVEHQVFSFSEEKIRELALAFAEETDKKSVYPVGFLQPDTADKEDGKYQGSCIHASWSGQGTA